MKAKMVGILIGILIVILAIYSFVKRKEYIAQEKSAKIYPQVLRLAYTKEGVIKNGQVFLGKFVPKNEATISSRINAYIIYIANEGTKVKKGDVLVRLDDSDIISNINAIKQNQTALAFQRQSLESNLKALETKYKNQIKIYKRDKILYENKAISEEAFEKSQDIYQEAKSQYESAIRQIEALGSQMNALGYQAKALDDTLKYAIIKAPFDGIVSKRYLKEGNLATVGKPLLDLEGIGNDYEVYVDVPENILPYIKNGDKAKLLLNGKSQEATIETIIPKASNNMVSIKLLTNKDDINAVPDTYVKTIIYKGECSGTLIPYDAVNHTSKGYFALGILNDEVHWIKFKPIARDGEYFCTKDIAPNIELGLSHRSQMLTLQEGQKVRIVK